MNEIEALEADRDGYQKCSRPQIIEARQFILALAEEALVLRERVAELEHEVKVAKVHRKSFEQQLTNAHQKNYQTNELLVKAGARIKDLEQLLVNRGAYWTEIKKT